MPRIPPGAVAAALRRFDVFRAVTPETLEYLPSKGLAHDHVRIRGEGMLVRIPRWSQLGLDPGTNLTHQAACFQRAGLSGHVPACRHRLPPDANLPMGGLVVDEVVGRPPRLPEDLPAIATALAALHALPLPAPEDRPPLASPLDPLAATRALVKAQAPWFRRARLAESVLRILDTEQGRLDDCPASAPLTLIGTDTHPGNFLLDAAGKAWLVDLEKAQYAHPALDLAHAILYTSTTWDPECGRPIDRRDEVIFLRAWAAEVSPACRQAVRRVWPWVRRLVWLRSLTWMARWRVEGETLGGQLPPSLIRHVAARIADFFDPDTLEQVRDSLETSFPSFLFAPEPGSP